MHDLKSVEILHLYNKDAKNNKDAKKMQKGKSSNKDKENSLLLKIELIFIIREFPPFVQYTLGGNTMTVFKQAPMKREELTIQPLPYVVMDHWIDYLGYEQFAWWMKFQTWVDRTETKYADSHIPYTLESVYEKLGTSRSSFYRKIKVLWECGLIEIVEFEDSKRKSQKPKNILVYLYPFHDITKKHKPLEKLRCWKKDFDSASKQAGLKGSLMKKMSTKEKDGFKTETVENSVEKYPPKTERVEKSVDNHPPKTERVGKIVDKYPPNSERVTLPKLGGINKNYNKLLKKTNNLNNSFNSLPEIIAKEIERCLTEFHFSEREIKNIISMLEKKGLTTITKKDIIKQAKFMFEKTGIRDRATYFVNGIQLNLGRNDQEALEAEQTTQEKLKKLENKYKFDDVEPFSWLDSE